MICFRDCGEILFIVSEIAPQKTGNSAKFRRPPKNRQRGAAGDLQLDFLEILGE
jgi:hypothetical protein